MQKLKAHMRRDHVLGFLKTDVAARSGSSGRTLVVNCYADFLAFKSQRVRHVLVMQVRGRRAGGGGFDRV